MNKEIKFELKTLLVIVFAIVAVWIVTGFLGFSLGVNSVDQFNYDCNCPEVEVYNTYCAEPTLKECINMTNIAFTQIQDQEYLIRNRKPE